MRHLKMWVSLQEKRNIEPKFFCRISFRLISARSIRLTLEWSFGPSSFIDICSRTKRKKNRNFLRDEKTKSKQNIGDSKIILRDEIYQQTCGRDKISHFLKLLFWVCIFNYLISPLHLAHCALSKLLWNES